LQSTFSIQHLRFLVNKQLASSRVEYNKKDKLVGEMVCSLVWVCANIGVVSIS